MFQRTDTYLWRLFDAILSFLVEFFVILAWHGLWTIQDLWQHDQNHSNEFTAWMSFGIGTAVNIMIFLTQFPYSILTDDTFDAEKSPSWSILKQIWAHIFGFIFSIMCLISAVTTFRGYWYLLDEYFMPNNYEMSLINSQIYGALVLFVLHCGCSLHAGIFGDVSKEKGGNMIEFYYSSYFFIRVSLAIGETSVPAALLTAY